MHNVLVFCRRDWLHPQAGPMGYYVHQVFSRIAAQGNFVSCLAQRHPWLPHPRRPQTELADGVQVARLGYGFLYQRVVTMFLSTLAQKKHERLRFHTLIDCVINKPLDLPEVTGTPLVPLVFDLDKRLQCVEMAPGPVLAATPRARRRLLDAGIPAKFVIAAYHGAGPVTEPAAGRAPEPLLAVAGRLPRYMCKALRILRRAGCPFTVASCNPLRAPEQARRLFQQAWAGYCGAGHEYCAPEMAACGLPALMAAQADSESEYIADGATGFSLGRDASVAADCLMRLAHDAPLRASMGDSCREYARAHSWDATAGLVLAVIENLRHELDLGASPEPISRQKVTV